MDKIVSGDDKVYVCRNYLSKKECDKYFNMIKDIGHKDNFIPWNERIKYINDDPIVEKVTKYINKRFNKNISLDEAQIQNHNVNSFSPLHIHNGLDREHIEYNSLIYLNDDFEGGYFFTKNGIKIKPEKGMLTFFNGQKVYHGVERVLKKDRKTIILWWNK